MATHKSSIYGRKTNLTFLSAKALLYKARSGKKDAFPELAFVFTCVPALLYKPLPRQA